MFPAFNPDVCRNKCCSDKKMLKHVQNCTNYIFKGLALCINKYSQVLKMLKSVQTVHIIFKGLG